MIKQIQLRGISRTPSDRLSEDGGLSESLNMYLDTAENAPVLVPKDVTCKLGLPADLQAERVFIHKTAEYENYIIVQGSSIKASIPDKDTSEIFSLEEGEKVNDISSIGNTVIFATSHRTYFILWKQGAYVNLGSNIPDFALAFCNVGAKIDTETGELNPKSSSPRYKRTFSFSGSIGTQWGKAEDGYKVYDQNCLTVLKKVHSEYLSLLTFNKNLGFLNTPIFIRYAVTLYDKSKWMISAPIIVGATFNDIYGNSSPSDLFITCDENEGVVSCEIELCAPYAIGYKAVVENPDSFSVWKDIISSIDIYASHPVNLYPNGDQAAIFNKGVLTLDPATRQSEANLEAHVMSYGTFFKVKSFSLDEFLSLTEQTHQLKVSLSEEHLSLQEKLDDNLYFEEIIAKKLFSYNNAILSCGAQKKLTRGLPCYNGQHASYLGSNSFDEPSYYLRFYISDNVVDGNKNLLRNVGSFDRGGSLSVATASCYTYAFLSYPDKNCSKVDVVMGNDTRTYTMKPHPTIPNCSYAWIGLSHRIDRNGEYTLTKDMQENRLVSLSNKLLQTPVDNPFVFPPSKRITFQANLIGVAIATTALSQGQFGQFPLYIFTEAGIWAMETAADGSFISQKPLSREVCTNPDSITSIDNAVVFVTDKGVMMIQGSQVINISPYMNGRHYIPNESATSIIASQEGFGELENAIKDETPFVAFMKKAKIAYDYAGQRLICIADNETFQYVYKIDTQTWHKTLFEKTILRTPINSFPECFTLGSFKISENKKAQILSLLKLEQWSDLEQAITDGTSFESSEHEQETTIADKVCALGVVTTTTFKGDILRVVVSDISRNNVSAKQADIERIQTFMEGPRYIDALMLGQRKREIFRCSPNDRSTLLDLLSKYFTYTILTEEQWHEHKFVLNGFRKQAVYSLDTILDVDPEAVDAPDVAKGILITRPFDLGEPDVYKSIKSIKIRGDFDKENVKYILQGSDNGRDFYTLTSLRGKSWKMFRIFILADLEPTERISWIDVDYEPRYQNKLR